METMSPRSELAWSKRELDDIVNTPAVHGPAPTDLIGIQFHRDCRAAGDGPGVGGIRSRRAGSPLQVVLLAAFIWAGEAAAQCSKDTDCKGDRVCEGGRCISPSVMLAPPTTPSGDTSAPKGEPTAPPVPPPEPTGPAPARKPLARPPGSDGKAVDEALREAEATANEREPRPAEESRSRPRRKEGEAIEEEEEEEERERKVKPLSGFVSDGGVRGTAMFFPTSTGLLSLPGFGIHGQWGGRITNALAIVGALNGDLLIGPNGTGLFLAAAPGLRLGERHHLTMSIGPEMVYFSTSTTGAFFAGMARLEVVVVIAGRFTGQLQAGIHFDSFGIQAFHFGIGLGWTTF